VLQIIGIARSRAFRCLWAAEEAGLPYEHVQIGFGQEDKAAVLAANPNGKLPALRDGALTLFESLAINLHIAGKAGAPFMPSGDDASRVMQWTLWAGTEAEPHAQQWAYNTYMRPADQRDAALAKAGAEALRQRLAVLEAHLAGGGPNLLGDAFTVADVNVASVLYGSWFNGFDYTGFPKAKAWLDASMSRPAAQKARKLREG
jgi:glutathione S-transferase